DNSVMGGGGATGGNSAGGAVYAGLGGHIRTSTLANNAARASIGTTTPGTAFGGAGWAREGGPVGFRGCESNNSTYSNKSADTDGGALCVGQSQGGLVNLQRLTVAYNVAGGEGGGIASDDTADLLLLNAIVSLNYAVAGQADLAAALRADSGY